VLLLEEAETNAVPVAPQRFPVSDIISRSVNTTTVVSVHVTKGHAGSGLQRQSFVSRHETEVGSQLQAPADLTPPPPGGSVDAVANNCLVLPEIKPRTEHPVGKAISVLAYYRLRGFQEVEALRFPDNRHMKVIRLSALRNVRLYPSGNIPGTHLCWRLSRLQGHSAAGRIVSMINSNKSNLRPSDL
jgi:hypothetical protein